MDDFHRVREHIIEIHQFFVDWVSGECPSDDATFQKGALNRLSENLMVIMPAGRGFGLTEFSKYMRAIHGSNSKFRIQIRNINLRQRIGDALLVTYEEWERDALDSMPANNGRLSTMVLKDRGDSLETVHVHETWLPAEVMDAGPYDF